MQQILSALEGVVYISDRHGEILAKGQPNWTAFASDNDAPHLAWATTLNCLGACQDDETMAAYRELYKALWSRKIEKHVIAFRCDSPSVRREFRLYLAPILGAGGVMGILHQSLPISETIRPPLNIFDPEVRKAALGSGPLVRICSYCLMILDEDDMAWIEAEEYYRRGGTSEVRLSHGICPKCRQAVLAPLGALDASNPTGPGSVPVL